jgi:hypothetical protein
MTGVLLPGTLAGTARISPQILCRVYSTAVQCRVMCGVRLFRHKETTHMRRVKLAVIPAAVALSQLLGPAAANGYFRIK